MTNKKTKPVSEEIDVHEQSHSNNICDFEEEEIQVNAEEMLLEAMKQKDELTDRLMRMAAEFENFKKRTAKEKDTIYQDAVGDTLIEFLPVLDNIERAISCACENDSSILQGVEMVKKQFAEILSKLGAEKITALNEKFDPNYHNAVMHVTDEEKDEGIIVEEFMPGYIFKDKVIRHSMVKVAN